MARNRSNKNSSAQSCSGYSCSGYGRYIGLAVTAFLILPWHAILTVTAAMYVIKHTTFGQDLALPQAVREAVSDSNNFVVIGTAVVSFLAAPMIWKLVIGLGAFLATSAGPEQLRRFLVKAKSTGVETMTAVAKSTGISDSAAAHFKSIGDNFESLEDVQEALRASGFESSSLIVAIDFTASNEEKGAQTFGGASLHALSNTTPNPYQQVLEIIGKTLSRFDDDNLIPMYGFGDSRTRSKAVFPMQGLGSDGLCDGLDEALAVYTRTVGEVRLSGPTSFTPAIREAMRLTEREGSYHILLLITDGATMTPDLDAATIVDASELPLSIICVGVGDGPWEQMEKFDDELPARCFDNFQFVAWSKVLELPPHLRDVAFARMALMEVPEQFAYLRSQDMIH